MLDETVDVSSAEEEARRGPQAEAGTDYGVCRGCAMSAAAAAMVLPWVWASQPVQVAQKKAVVEQTEAPVPELAFYRKYTEAMLRRYLRLSMEVGRVPSLLGQEMFRGKVTSYRVNSFEDVVIFVHDVEKCIAMLGKGQQTLVRRIALEEYTQVETATMLGVSARSVIRQYSDTLDRLTALFIERKMLEPQKACQGGSLMP